MSLLDQNGISNTADRLLATAKRNPEGVLLLVAGAALLMRRTGMGSMLRSSRSNGRANGHQRNDQYGEENMTDRARGMTDTARSYASDISERVTRSAEGVADYTTGMARAAADRSSRLAHDTGTTVRGAMDRMLEEQPLTLALFGLAAGAVLASALPATGTERSALGPMGKRLNDAAGEAGQRLKKSAARVGERLTEMADERGLNARGLREGAREVAQAFSEEMTTGEQQQQGAKQGSARQGQQQASGDDRSRGVDPMDPARRMQSSNLGSSSSDENRSGQGGSSNSPSGGRLS